MKPNKISLAITALVMLAILLPAKSTFARAETGDSSQNQEQNNVSTSEDTQQTNEPVKVESNDNRSETDTIKTEGGDKKSETSSMKQKDEYGNKSETGTMKKEENGDKTESSTMKQEDENIADAHRSVVASFVSNLLQVADKNKNNIGEQVRAIAQEQESSTKDVAEQIKTVENRNSIKTFLIGTDYKNIGMIRSEMVKTSSRIDQLNRLLETMTTSTGSATTSQEIQNLTAEQTKLENFLQQNENKFSLFGWFVKLFNK